MFCGSHEFFSLTHFVPEKQATLAKRKAAWQNPHALRRNGSCRTAPASKAKALVHVRHFLGHFALEDGFGPNASEPADLGVL